MKHIRLLTTLVLLVLAGRTHADNLSVSLITIAPGEAKQINIALTNSDRKYAAFQFDLQLPEGITIAKDDNNKLIASLDNSRKVDHSFTISDLGDNKYRLLAYSMTNSAFLGTNGAIVNISVISDAAIIDGIKKAYLKSQVFTDANGNQYNLDELAFNIEIATPVNDKLSVADITMPAEGKKQIEIALNNSDRNYAAFQFDMELPDGLTIQKDGNDKFVASLNTGRISDHSLTVSKLSGNVYRVLSYSMTNAEITGSNGALINISINSAEDIDDGQYVAKLESLVFTDASGKQYNLTDAAFNISIVTPVITAENKTREYGLDNPEFTYSSDVEISGKPELTTTATKTSSVGNYDIVVNQGTVEGRITGVKGTLTITTKTVSNPSITLSETSYTYDGTAKKPTVTVKDGETTIPSTEYSVSYTNNTNVGTATVTITDVEGGNYAVSGNTTFSISSADGSLTAPTGISGLVYNGSAQNLINAGSTTTGTLEYSLDGTTYAETIPQGTDAGSYTVYYKVIGDANHNDIAVQNFQVTIASKTVESPTITLSETSYTYDGNAKEPTVTVKDGETTIPATEYSVSYTNNTNVGTATVTITDVEGGNYAVSGSTTFAISSADGSLNPPVGKSDLVYNGTAQDLITAGSSTTGTMEYSLDGTTYAETIPQGTDAGSYTVYYKVTGDANHNDIAAQHFDVTIAKAALTVSAGNYEIFEGEEIPSFEIKYDGFVNNETGDALITKPTISCEATVGSKPDEYKVTVSGAEAKNYEITYVDGKLTILAKSFVSGGDDDKDEDDPATYQITSNEGEGDTPPTVAITDDKDVSGAFDIPEAVTYNNKIYTVTEIGEGAFENNTNLTSVSIPSSITNIGDKAFKGCSNLKSITVNLTTPISLSVLAATRRMMTRADGSSVFDGVDKATCILYVPEGSVDLYKAAPVWCEFKNILAIGSTGIKEILMTDGEAHDVYNLQGRKVKAKATSLEGLPRGVYVVKGKKISIN